MVAANSRPSRLRLRSPAGLRGLRVTVMGLGTKGGGVEAVKYLVRHKALVTVTDVKTAADLRPSVEVLRGLPVEFVLGAHRDEDFLHADLVIQNPAVPRNSPYLSRARGAGVPVETDISLFFLFCPAPIGAVTGTRGKSTATTVAGLILREKRPDTVIAGNIQRSPLADLDKLASDSPVVLELSSWQLEGIAPHRQSPHWAVVTTLLPDHLNRYDSFADYVAAKEIIVRYQTADDVAILPTDDTRASAFARLTKGTVYWFGPYPDNVLPARAGVFRRGRDVIFVRDGVESSLLPWDEMNGRGDITKRNMLAGATLALSMGAGAASARQVLRTFPGLPHRLETVRVNKGRTYVNDTSATTPEAVVAALGAYSEHRIVLITGGTDKGLDYRPLAGALTDNVAHVILLDGSATSKLRPLLRDTKFRSAPVVRIMADAVAHAAARSLPGDVVLLSPGAASFELFRDEFDRGEQFRRAVQSIPDSIGPP